jgi:hypothetical protein
MKKYLAYYENEWPADIAELTAVENKPFIGYLKGEGLAYTVVPEPVTGPADNEIWYTSSDGNIVTPKKTDVFGVNIVSNTYEDGNGVIKFDNSVTSIGENAFQNCSSLTSVTIPSSVTRIGAFAFQVCKSLTSVAIPNNVTSIGWGAFDSCSSLTSVSIPNGVTEIGIALFGGCFSLTSITIPNNVTSIGNMAFDNCSSLTSITYEGTQEQWNSITKGSAWNYNAPATYVQCSDGQVTL